MSVESNQIEMFLTTFITVFGSIFQLFLISAAAGLLVKKEIVSPVQIQALSTVTVNVFLPCLMISKVVSTFDPGSFPLWWTLPLSGFLLVSAGLGFSSLLFRMNPSKRPLLPLASIQNAIYIVLPIGKILYPHQFDVFALYSFLVTLGITPIMWSLGKVLLTDTRNAEIQWRDFITPPLVATLLSILAVFVGGPSFLPQSVIAPIDLLGQATVPLAVFILGATLGMISIKDMPSVHDTLIIGIVKFILVPLTTFVMLYGSGIYQNMPLFSSMMIIQASSPPATNLILIVKNYGGDTHRISSMMLLQYLFAILMMPLWIALWQLI